MAERGPASARARVRARASTRPTVGLVTAGIHIGVGVSLWSGVLEAAERNDVNLVVFPGDALRPAGAPRNALYDLIGPLGGPLGPLRLDGAVCWTSTLGLPAPDDERAERLTRRLTTLPVVSLNRALDEGRPDHETLLLDSYAGMRKAVGHLVEVHGRRRLACLRGPLANPVSVNRYRAYTDALSRHRIPHDAALVAASVDFEPGAGASAMRVLVDVRGLRPGHDFDAVVAVSDVLAADALRFLAERGVRVPEDVAVISFNDSLEARIADPPLTSVALPFAELGALAVDTLLARLRGARPPGRRVVPGTLVTRRSCGCHSPLVSQGETDQEPAPEAREDERDDAGDDAADHEVRLPEATAELGEALRADLAAPHGVGFLGLLERHLDRWIESFEDVAAWDRALLRLRARHAASPRAERLLGQARLLVADKSYRLLEYERWAREQESRRLRELGTTLTTVTDTEAIRNALARHLPGLGVPGCRLVLNGGGAGGGAANGSPRRLTRPPHEGRFTAVLEPLHIGEEQLGYALFDAGPRQLAARHGALYRALGDQISAALKGVLLFEEVRRARDAAEQASQFKTRLLDNVTDELRTPVEAILRHTRGRDPATAEDAERLLRLIDDLLDLSRSEIDALDLTRRLLDPGPLLAEAFTALARPGWRLSLPRRLPALRADATRLRQMVRGLLTAAGSGAAGATTELAAEAGVDRLHIRVTSPGLARQDERLFEPFASGERGSRLGLAIARRLAVLHGGSVTLLRGDGATTPGFHVELPLPTPAEPASPPAAAPAAPGERRRVLLAASRAEAPAKAPGEELCEELGNEPGLPAELAALVRREGLTPHPLHPDDDIATLTSEPAPAAVVWDTGGATPQDWATISRLHDHPALRHTPFLLYGLKEATEYADLSQALRALRPSGLAEPALIVDASEHSREALRVLLHGVLPGRPVRAAADGTAACALFAEDPPGLLIVDRALPDMDGFELVERLSETTGQQGIPVLMLSDNGFAFADARRAERHPGVVLLGREILTEAETARLLTAMLHRARTDPTAQRTYAPVRHALAYLEEHYRHRFSRWQIAQAAGVSEDHLGRLFHRELGVTLWEYLTRLRIRRAKERLQRSDDSVQTIARAVGFHDRAYFSRVFRKVTGIAPHAFRDAS